MRQSLKSALRWILSTPLVVAAVIGVSMLYQNEHSTPRGVETIQDYYRRYGEPHTVRFFAINGRTFYRVVGEIAAPLAFPRGNPQYIFDDTGRLVDWSSAVDGDPDFRARWDDSLSRAMIVSYFLERFPPGN